MIGATPEGLEDAQIEKALQNILRRIGGLEANDYFRPSYVVGETSNPPTLAEINALLGNAVSYNGNMVALINDTTNNRQWLLYGNNVTWYFTGLSEVGNEVLACKVFNSIDQAIVPNTPTILSFLGEFYDYGGFHDSFVNNPRLTAPVTGLYTIKANVRWEFGLGGYRAVQIIKNGTDRIGSTVVQPGTSFPVVADLNVVVDEELDAGDYVEVLVQHDAPVATLNVVSAEATLPWFSIVKIR